MSANELMTDLFDVVRKYEGNIPMSTVVGVLEILKAEVIQHNFKLIKEEMQNEKQQNI